MKIAVALTSLILLASGLVAVQPAAAVVVTPTPVVQGNKLVDSATGATFVPHGVNIPGLEYSCVQGWRTLPAANEFTKLVEWKINTVRLPLNESCWLGLDGAPSGSTVSQYRADVAAWVSGATAAGLVVILDLHWNAPAGYAASGQRAMPDPRSAAFWTSIATTYSANKSVMFELFNEPYSRSGFTLTWDCWKNGGCQAPVENDATGSLGGATYTVTGMQTLVSAVRTAGATQPLLLGGLNYSNDLTGWLANKPTDPLNQLVAAWHNYPGQGCSTTCWNSTVTTVAASVPIVTTEFGNTAETTSTVAGNSGNYLVPFMTWADAHGIGYLPWAWWDVGAAEAAGNGSDIYALYTGDFVPKAPSGTKFHDYLAGLAPPVTTPPGAGAIAKDSAGALFLIDGTAKKFPITTALAADFGLGTAITMTDAISATLTVAATALTIAVSCGGNVYIAGGGKLWKVPAAGGLPTTALDATTCAALPKSTQNVTGSVFLQGPNNGNVYYIANGIKRGMSSWALVDSLNGGNPRVIIPASLATIAAIPDTVFGPGSLAKDPSGALFLIDGLANKFPITSALAADFGLTTALPMTDATSATYAVASTVLNVPVTCGGNTYIAGGGQLWKVPAAGGLPTTALDATTCAALPKSAQTVTGSVFLQGPNSGNVYYIANGIKRGMTSWALVDSLNGGAPRVIIPASLATIAAIPDSIFGPGSLGRDSAGALYLIDGTTKKFPITAALAADFGLGTAISMTDATSASYAVSTTALSIAISCGGNVFIAGGGQLWKVPAAGGLPTTALDAATCAALPKSAQIVTGSVFLQGPNSGNVYYIANGIKRIMTSWALVDSLNGGAPRVIIPASLATIAAIPDSIFGPGSLAKDPAGALFLIDGTAKKFAITAALAADFGLGTAITMTDATSASYAVSTSALSIAVSCGGNVFIAGGGQLWKVPAAGGLATTALEPVTCAALPKSAQTVTGSVFLQGPNSGNVYYIANGTKRSMTSWALVDSLNGGNPRVMIPASLATINAIPNV